MRFTEWLEGFVVVCVVAIVAIDLIIHSVLLIILMWPNATPPH